MKEVQKRIQGRKDCEEVLGLILEGKTKEYREGVARACFEMFSDLLPKASNGLLVMSDKDAKEFEKTPRRYGIHRDIPNGDVPIKYLVWLADDTVEVQAYLRSARGKKRIEEESEDGNSWLGDDQ